MGHGPLGRPRRRRQAEPEHSDEGAPLLPSLPLPPPLPTHGGLKVGGIADVEMVSCGGSFTLALTRDGRLYAWGDDAYGNLGALAPSLWALAPLGVGGDSG